MAADLETAHENPIPEVGFIEQQSSGPDQIEPVAIEQEMKDTVVDWDGPDDPQDPRNWPTWKRITQVVLVTSFLFTANLAATMFAPGAAALAKEFHITNPSITSLTVSIYLAGFAIGPMFIAPLSEIYGRLVIYHICNVFYIGLILGCALGKNTGMFLALRFLAGCAASGPLAVGGGTVADVIPPAQRGKAMSLFFVGPLLGPVFGPIIGGFVSETIGWRWTFWIILILIGVAFTISIFFLRETNGAVLLEWKAARLRKETGNAALVSKMDRGLNPRQLFLRAIVRPTKLLILSPIVLLLAFLCAFLFGLLFLLFTTFPSVFETQYHFSAGISGLAYLGVGLGMASSLATFATVSDKLHRALGDAPKPEGRLKPMMWVLPAVPVGVFWYGWSAEKQTHWIVPIIGTFFFGFGILWVLMPTQLYMVDAFGAEAAASALAANAVLRLLFAAFIPLAGPSLYAHLGLGWGNSVLAFIGVAFLPVPLLFYRYGGWLRERFPVKL
ncbi:major facilitator superfamily domain-containing protein [Penicillium chermesinum]|uniref:Major facilitator superfamily domain-containing protein n=1 Tax=Penicillium chermesinum TaxID=63820 RepID=A0A9W9NTP5_9EURO|nr:major facilitator superfamily domain-containing protein [Penicillium chermesinum]KAJ5225990.1 major facilitator superfamily domain-containing protein [Penicillium chermesinum]